ncbi:hypothetical protein TanjilG_05593 [Lupinus angustifolius]|uniref:Bifunctional inhibitor/plant lipid transfer protein/seed storage helical domain-containing protein n=2 Tax=Lupinus angustifolius TaxID=3871 RepID=A0A4P1QSB5_LUPAN|nr:hypothetical protein TanjilG_05593 [Lupinus angustifolius]
MLNPSSTKLKHSSHCILTEMARLTILIALFAALVLVVHTSAFRSEQSYVRNSEESEELEQCCDQLNELNNQRCQYRKLQQIFENQSEQLERRQQEQQFEQELQKLPRTCGFGPLGNLY